MGTQTISFKVGPRRDKMGFSIPSGSDIPKMKGRKKASVSWLIEKLDSALENLAYSDCSFWACEGPNRPKDMCTCKKCWAMRDIAAVRATLVRSAQEQ